MLKIRCVVERITYQNPENGYTVLKVRVKGYRELVPVTGNLLDVNVGSVLVVEGNWKIDTRYGRQFIAEKWEETLPATVYGIEKYLGSGLIKGIGPKYAKKIVQEFGTDTIPIIEDNIEQLLNVGGIGRKRVEMIRESWEKQKEVKNIMLFLQESGINTSFAAKIYARYGNKSIEKIKENPFCLADDIWGIGFRTADIIAQKLGVDRQAYIRLRSGIMYTLGELSGDGHVYAEHSQLFVKASALLDAEEEYIIMTADQMVKDGDLILEEDAVYLPPFYYAEIGTASKLSKLAGKTQDGYPVTYGQDTYININKIEEKLDIKYDQLQVDAIRQASVSKVMVLTGGPGTGKTTVTKGIIAMYQEQGLKILLAAPTGRAAKRMTEATGIEAKTIHRLLECKPPEGYQKNNENPLEGDVLIVDECSMIDILLMNSLLKAVPENMKLVLAGDINQLPSVGPGNVLRDIIDSGKFPVIRLNKIFRQAQSSRIIMNSHRINAGKMPNISNGKNTDFFFIQKETPEQAAEEIVTLVKYNLPKYYKVPVSQIQVLAPLQRGAAGAVNLNLILQEALNPSGAGIRRSGYIFRQNDKVMQIKNNYDKEVFNGDIGIIERVNFEERTLIINFDGRHVEYEDMELDEIVLAYATTIHKAQGSEYPIVVMPLLMEHYVMLQRNLVYTGITRAKKILVIVGTKNALAYSVKNLKVTNRNTMLKERLCQ
ncbi:MAG: ATP-dependent RecD-like DNA helicase [Lachnospiraceae bacterium]|nr:ATP-dependent RecD-like DNA helicase [Lachnospiraceae bacterium]